MYYQIKETLTPCTVSDIREGREAYVAIITREEFDAVRETLGMGIDIGFREEMRHATTIQVNYDSLTGTFCIPDKTDIQHKRSHCSFAIDAHGVIFFDDDDGLAANSLERIIATKKWKLPSLERFLFDVLEGLLDGDLMMLENYEKEMDAMEDAILAGKPEGVISRLADIRSVMVDLQIHYEQLNDLAHELVENENEFFDEDNLRYFRLFSDRVDRHLGLVASLRDHVVQIRDMHRAYLEEKQNNNMTYLTVIATIFLPLSLLTSWYGMNFTYMPELESPWSYPILVAVCVAIVVGSIILFRRKKWF